MKMIQDVISTLREQIAAREKAIQALGKLDGAGPALVTAPVVKQTRVRKTKRTMSPEGRARIAAAQKARWAKARRLAKRAA